MKTPRISVLLPVYNAERFLEESIYSILNQTFSDFELLICDDGSTDRSLEIIRSFKDRRIILMRNVRNLGLANTLNKLIDASRGEFIARQDSDDISLPKRLGDQVDFLKRNPDIGLCGTQITWFGTRKKRIHVPLKDEDIKVMMLVYNPICHPTVMMRKSCLTMRFDQFMNPAEDYAFWYTFSKKSKLANLPDLLLNYRWHDTNMSIAKEQIQIEKANLIKTNIFQETLSYEIADKEMQLLNLVSESSLSEYNDLLLFEKFLITVRSKNRETAYYNDRALHRRLFLLWSSACFKLKGISLVRRFRIYFLSELFSFNRLVESFSLNNTRKLLKNLTFTTTL